MYAPVGMPLQNGTEDLPDYENFENFISPLSEMGDNFPYSGTGDLIEDFMEIPALPEEGENCEVLTSPILRMGENIGENLISPLPRRDENLENLIPPLPGVTDHFVGLPGISIPCDEGEDLLASTSDTDTNDDGEMTISDPSVILNNLRAKNPNKPIIAQININFLEKKFEPLLSLVKDTVDILMISETKLDDTFPYDQFKIEGFAQQFRLDRNCHGGGIIIYVKDHLPCKRITTYSICGSVA